MKYSFRNDYSEGCAKEVMEALIKTNFSQSVGYGLDDYCTQAKEIIKKHINHDSDIHFLVGGTQTNFTFIRHALKSHESIISCDTGHINTHETGAVEACGHKIVTVKNVDGKLNVESVDALYKTFTDEHLTKPKMIYISNSTELGTTYTKSEIIDIYNFAKAHDLYLFIDGARLGSALMIEGNDIHLSDYAMYSDAFYIGGTKNGALFGECLVINNEELAKDFRYAIKQNGAMLAKGRLLGVQFKALFEDGLYYRLAKNANDCANYLKEELSKRNITFLVNSNTNQIFPIFPNYLHEELSKLYDYGLWEEIDDQISAYRLVTSWMTKMSICKEFIKDLDVILDKLK